ncbi:MAG: phospholipase D-like domain-containing protein [Candidatus Acidiferrales bacterium]
MKLIIQPDEGITPVLSLIKAAKHSVSMTVFRFDRRDLEKELKAAMGRGVKINALIACANHGGEKSLRNLELRFLEAGASVARTADDLIRYHDKVIVIDSRILCVLSFNFTYLDIDRSRGFGIITKNKQWVLEATRLLDADCKRAPYKCGSATFVVSPFNARRVLGDFLKKSRKQLLIYDPKISDREMIRILRERQRAGVEIQVIGQSKAGLSVRGLPNMRLHTRTIIRDGAQAFIGSQSLRANELDARREVGLIVRDAKIVNQLIATFQRDWKCATDQKAKRQADAAKEAEPPKADTEQAIKLLTKELHPITTTVKKAVEKVVVQAGEEILEDGEVRATVKKVIKKAVKQAVKQAVQS